MGLIKDIKGKRFGRLVALQLSGKKNGRLYWLCRCDCGVEKEVASLHLCTGRIRSCGCLARELICKRNTIHGHSRRGKWHRLYGVWFRMMGRCLNPKDQNWHHYGGRGITVCERWKNIDNFIEDMDPSFEKGLEIERNDNDGPYSP